MELSLDNRQEELEITSEMEEIIMESIEASIFVEGLNGDYEVSLSFVSPEEIRELNSYYRGVDEVTDVLSFPMDDEFSFGIEMLGDVVINTDRVISQANELGHSFERELSYLTVHSIFHLLGYDHIEEVDKEEMRAKEKATMKYLGVFKNEEK
ncbi:MAG: rRNA maturation RNase YbeY [Tissierellia bacterium]|nr:rRNA maturation RNase YbeY [Tissierellia bacterium]